MRSLAGLGLFFFGIKMITRNLSAMAGDQFRRGLDNASRRNSVAVAFGTASGFVTQSGRTTSFILASFVQAGLIEARRAIPIVLWANFGCTLVIFTAVFPIQLLALFLIAIGGVAVAFERPKPLLTAISAVFGLALMLYGLQMMSSAAAVMINFPWFASALAFIKLSLIFAFLMGLVLTFVAQSHIAIMLIAVTMASKHIFDFDQTLMVIYGAHIGSSVNTWVAGVHFQGKPRQVVTAQVLYNLVGVGLFVFLFVVEQLLFGRSVLLSGLVHRVTTAPGVDDALAAVLLNFVTPLAISAAFPLFYKLCERLAPPQHHEELGKPEYLRDEVSGNSVATLILVEKEQLRLLKRLPAYCAWSRGEGQDGPAPRAYHDAFLQVNKHIQRFQTALLSQRMSPEDTEWLLNQQRRQELLVALDETCLELSEAAGKLGPEAEHIRLVVVEALDTFLLTAVDAADRQDSQELDLLDTMTRDRGPAMERLRNRYLTTADRIAADERNRVLQITSLFERGAWCLNRFAALLRQAPGFSATPQADAATQPLPAATAA
ncbi:MAG TPA: Na/Pi symporter [Caulobacteraceae bacterium]